MQFIRELTFRKFYSSCFIFFLSNLKKGHNHDDLMMILLYLRFLRFITSKIYASRFYVNKNTAAYNPKMVFTRFSRPSESTVNILFMHLSRNFFCLITEERLRSFNCLYSLVLLPWILICNAIYCSLRTLL